MSTSPAGLRERKKQQTREHIAETARRLFEERGFDHVRVAEVAQEADVAVKTVFNYFPTKEDLFYSRLETFEEELLETVKGRKPGTSVLSAVQRFLQSRSGFLAGAGADTETAAAHLERLRATMRVISESPALLARERQVLDRYTRSLAAAIGEETGARPGDIEPWVAANALIGAHAALLAWVRQETLAGKEIAEIERGWRRQAKRAFGQLENGLGDLGVADVRSSPDPRRRRA